MITANPTRLAEVHLRLPSIQWFLCCLVDVIAPAGQSRGRCMGRFFEDLYRVSQFSMSRPWGYEQSIPVNPGTSKSEKYANANAFLLTKLLAK